jgi:hypothetical protein
LIALNLLSLNSADASSLSNQIPGSAQSIISSSSTLQDFTAILTEMVGPVSPIAVTADTANTITANPINSAPLLQNAAQLQNPLVSGNAQTPVQLTNPSAPAASYKDALDATSGLQQLPLRGQVNPQEAPQAPRKAQDPSQPNQAVIVPFVPVAVANSVMTGQKVFTGKDDVQQQKPIDAAAGAPPVSPQWSVPPEVQRAWADVKKFEFTVKNEPAKPGAAPVQAQISQVDAQKEAIVTTDPIANIQLQQLPPRIVAIEKLVPDAKLPDKAKAEIAKDSTDTPTTVPTGHFTVTTNGADQIEQVRPAQPVEIPQTPHLPVVRTVAMEVGDADSQVTVRIQERAGDISLQISAANEPLHQDLQSSVGSLVQTLKQEQVQVSNVDVSKKSPIEKVRRMKETNS